MHGVHVIVIVWIKPSSFSKDNLIEIREISAIKKYILIEEESQKCCQFSTQIVVCIAHQFQSRFSLTRNHEEPKCEFSVHAENLRNGVISGSSKV